MVCSFFFPKLLVFFASPHHYLSFSLPLSFFFCELLKLLVLKGYRAQSTFRQFAASMRCFAAYGMCEPLSRRCRLKWEEAEVKMINYDKNIV